MLNRPGRPRQSRRAPRCPALPACARTAREMHVLSTAFTIEKRHIVTFYNIEIEHRIGTESKKAAAWPRLRAGFGPPIGMLSQTFGPAGIIQAGRVRFLRWLWACAIGDPETAFAWHRDGPTGRLNRGGGPLWRWAAAGHARRPAARRASKAVGLDPTRCAKLSTARGLSGGPVRPAARRCSPSCSPAASSGSATCDARACEGNQLCLCTLNS